MATEPCNDGLDNIVPEHEPTYGEQVISKLDEIINDIGGGSGGGILVIPATYTWDDDTQTETITMQKTAGEIMAAFESGTPCYVYWVYENGGETEVNGYFIETVRYTGTYEFAVKYGDFEASTSSDYPVYSEGQ